MGELSAHEFFQALTRLIPGVLGPTPADLA
jgi:hypothetical protein